MFKVNRKIEYALIALKHMSQHPAGQLTSAKEICETYGIPFDPTSRVLQLMAQQGILKAEHGAHGGYQIQKDLMQVSLNDLTDIIIGPIQIVNCFHNDFSHCGLNTNCNVIAPMLNLNAKLSQLFKATPVKELIDSRNSGEKNIKLKPYEKMAIIKE